MEPFTALSLLGTGVSLFGGLLSGNDSEQYLDMAMKQYEGIVPPDLARAIVYTQFQQGGQLTPEQLSQLPIEAQQVVLLQENPEMRQKQSAQLQALEQLASTGMGAQERFALEQSRLKAAQDAQARMQGIMQQYAQMGRGGGPAAMLAQVQGLQQTEQNEYMANLQAAAMAAQNRRDAIQAAMSGAGQLRQQDLNVQESNVQAMRQRQLFDIQNAMARQQWNAQAAQQANMMNLQRQQQTMDRNIQMGNEELRRRMYEAPMEMFRNQLALAQGRAGVYQNRANIEQQQAAAAGQNWANIGAGIGGIGTAMQQQRNFDKMMDFNYFNSAMQTPRLAGLNRLYNMPSFYNAPQGNNYFNQQQTGMMFG